MPDFDSDYGFDDYKECIKETERDLRNIIYTK